MLEDRKSPQTISGAYPATDHFRREMDSLISRFFGGASPFSMLETAAQRTGMPSLDMTGAISPAIDVQETDDAIALTAELPGLGEDDVAIEVKDRRLTLRGEKKITFEDKADVHISERSYGSFARTMMIPESVDVEKISAEFDKGVLHITMPKNEPEDPSRKIKVSSK